MGKTKQKLSTTIFQSESCVVPAPMFQDLLY